MWAMAMKEFRQMRRDRRTLAMMILLPVLLLVVFGYAASFDVDRVRTVVVGPRAGAVATPCPSVWTWSRWPPARAMSRHRGPARRRRGGGGGDHRREPQVLVDEADLFSARSVVTELRAGPGCPPPRSCSTRGWRPRPSWSPA